MTIRTLTCIVEVDPATLPLGERQSVRNHRREATAIDELSFSNFGQPSFDAFKLLNWARIDEIASEVRSLMCVRIGPFSGKQRYAEESVKDVVSTGKLGRLLTAGKLQVWHYEGSVNTDIISPTF